MNLFLLTCMKYFHFTIFEYPRVYIPFSKNIMSYPGTLGWNFCHFRDPWNTLCFPKAVSRLINSNPLSFSRIFVLFSCDRRRSLCVKLIKSMAAESSDILIEKEIVFSKNLQ